MPLVVFVPTSSFTNGHGVVNVGGGLAYDVAAALAAGGGEIIVDTFQQPILFDVLSNFPGLKVQGTSPGPEPNVDVLSSLVVHRLRKDGTLAELGDILERNSDGTYSPTQNTAPGSSVEQLTDAATVTFDISNSGGVLLSLSQPTTVELPNGEPTWQQGYVFQVTSALSQPITFTGGPGGFKGTALFALPTPVNTSGGGLTDTFPFLYFAASDMFELVGSVPGG